MKKLVAIVLTAMLVMGLSTTALAAALPAQSSPDSVYVRGYGWCGMAGYGLMRDENGNFLDRDAFEEKLDGAIDDGLIQAGDKSYYLDMYDYCTEYGGGYGRGGGCCGGRGRW